MSIVLLSDILAIGAERGDSYRMTMIVERDAERLRAFIEAAGNAETAKLPAEPKLSELLGISRGRLRTMLRRFESEGLIWRHVGKGTFVGPRQLAPDDGHVLASVSVDDILDARLIIEPQLAAQAAIHATDADIVSMEQCIAEMAASSSLSQWKRLDARLHRVVAEAAHNTVLLLLYDTLRMQVKNSLDVRIDEVFGAKAGPLGDTDEEHRMFFRAIKQHQPERAELAMRNHLSSVRVKLFGLR